MQVSIIKRKSCSRFWNNNTIKGERSNIFKYWRPTATREQIKRVLTSLRGIEHKEKRTIIPGQSYNLHDLTFDMVTNRRGL